MHVAENMYNFYIIKPSFFIIINYIQLPVSFRILMIIPFCLVMKRYTSYLTSKEEPKEHPRGAKKELL